MKLIDKMVEYFTRLNKKMKRWQRVVSVLSAIVVFATTYMLVLPAITLDVDTASTQAGIEVASENEPDTAGTVFESTEEEEPEEPEAEPAEEEETTGSVSSAQEEEAEPASEQEEAVESDSEQEEAVESASEEQEEESAASTSDEQEEVAEEPQTGSSETEAAQSGSGSTDSAVAEDPSEDASAQEAAADAKTTAETAKTTAETAKTAVTEDTPLIKEPTQLTYKGNDYTVYADFDESAKLPVGVELRVKEITKDSDPDAYDTYYKKALEELKDKYDENTGLSFAKFYDIAFVYNGQEIEPQGNVAIKIEYKKAVEIEEETKIDTIHFDKEDEDKVEIIDSEKEVTDKTKVESVEFESDKFSVYGVIGAETFTEKYLTEDGETYNISVTASPEAHIPSDAHLEVSEVKAGSDKYNELFKKAEAAVTEGKDASVPFARFFDISIVKDGEKIQPDAPVEVKITFDETVEADKHAVFNAVHISGNKTDVIDVTTEGTESEKAVTVDAVQFSADGFSIYGVTYTVDFEYTDPITGKTYYFSLNGEDSINLTDLLVALGIKGEDEVEQFVAEEVENVEFSDPELVRVTHKGKTLGIFGTEDWLLESLAPFNTEETLTITLKNGGEIVVKVTDEQDTTSPWDLANEDNTYFLHVSAESYVTESELERNAAFKLTFSYSLQEDVVRAIDAYEGNPVLEYDLTPFTNQFPVEIKNYSNGVISIGTRRLGTYVIRNGKVILTFTDTSYFDDRTTFTGYFNVTVQTDESRLNDDGEYTFTFPGTGDTIPVDYKDSVQNGSKNLSFEQDADGNYTLHYTANVDVSTNLDSLKFNDVIGGLQTLDASSVKIDGRPVSVTQTGNGFTFDVAAALGTTGVAKGSYQVTYDTKLTADQLKAMSTDKTTETNKVTWRVNGSKDVPGGETSKEFEKPKEPIPVTKEISSHANQPGDIVNYTITFGKETTELSGFHISDIMTDVVIPQGSVTLTYNGQSTPINFGQQATDNSYSKESVTLFDYTFPEGTPGYGPVTATYSVKLIDAETAKENGVYDTTEVNNIATEHRQNTNDSEKTTVTYEKEPVYEVKKSQTSSTNENGNWDPGTEIHYTLTIGDANTNMAGVNIKDVMTDLQILQYDVMIKVGNGSTMRLDDYVPNATVWTDDESYHSYDVELFNFNMPSDAGYGPVVITYTTKVISQEQATSSGIYGNVQINNTGTGGKQSDSTTGIGEFEEFPVTKQVSQGGVDVNGKTVVMGSIVHYTLTYGKAGMNLAGAVIEDEMTDLQKLVGSITVTRADGTSFEMPIGNGRYSDTGNNWDFWDDGKYNPSQRILLFKYRLPSTIGDGPITIDYDTQIITEEEAKESGIADTQSAFNKFIKPETEVKIEFPKEVTHNPQVRKEFDHWDVNEGKAYWDIIVEKDNDSAYPLEDVWVRECTDWNNVHFKSENQAVWDYIAKASDFDVINAVVTTDDGTVLTPGVDYTVDIGNAMFNFPVLNERVHINIAFISPVKIIDGTWMKNEVRTNNDKRDEAEATYNSPDINMIKNGVYTESDRLLKWEVLLNPSKKEFTDSDPLRVWFEDQIPEGLVLVNFDTKEEGNPSINIKYEGEGVWTSKTIPVTVDGETNRITKTDIAYHDPYDVNKDVGLNRQKIRVTYYTLLSDEEWDKITSSASGSDTFENRVKVTAGDDTTFEAYDTVTVTSENYLKKYDTTHSQDGSTLVVDEQGEPSKAITYQVDINPQEYVLNQGNPLSMTDYISTNMDLNPESVAVYNATMGADGKLIPGTTSPDGLEISYNDDSRLLSIRNIPDETQLVLVYTCFARAQGTDEFKNTATLIGGGSHSSTVTEEHTIQTNDAGVKVDGIFMNMLKIDENQISKKLEGAKFQLYECELAIGNLTQQPQSYWDELLEKMDRINAGGGSEAEIAQIMEQFEIVNYVPVGNPVVTGSSGFTQWTGLSEHKVYAWMEVEAPENYSGYEDYHYFVGYQHINVNSDQIPQPLLPENEQLDRKHAAWALDDAVQLANGIRVASMANVTTWTATNVETKYTSISATKEWENDSDNLFQTRPTGGIKLQLWQIKDDGSKEEYGDPVAINADDEGEWPTYIWNKLPANDAENEHLTYTVTEERIDNYTTSYSDNGEGISKGEIIVTNRMIPKKTDIHVKKVFVGDENDDKPASIHVTLMVIKTNKEGEAGEPEETSFDEYLRNNNGWQCSFINLPTTTVEEQSDGTKIPYTLSYTVVEDTAALERQGFHYTVTYSDNGKGVIETTEDDPLVITNSIPNGDLVITKDLIGDVSGDQYAEFKVTIKNSEGKYLQSDGKTFDNTEYEFTVNTDDELKIEELPLDEYTVEEKTGTGYTDVIDGYEWAADESITSGTATVTSDKDDPARIELVNSYKLGSVKVTKDFDGIESLPDSFKITATYSEGSESKTVELTVGSEGMTGTGTADDPYTWTIGSLPIGTEVTFTETGYEKDGYEVTVTGSAAADDKTIATAVAAKEPGAASFTNTYEPHGSLEITKNIQTDGVTDTTKTGTFYFAVYKEQYNAEISQKPIRTGSITVTENGTKTETVTDLPRGTYYVYELTGEGGEPIVSTEAGTRKVINETVYTVTGSGTTATVSETSGTATLNNNIETVKAKVKKVWDDNGSDKRPDSLSVSLYAHIVNEQTNDDNAGSGRLIQTVQLSNENGWESDVIEKLPKFDASGNEINYEWVEDNLPAGYFLTSTTEEAGTDGTITTTITNTLGVYDLETSYSGIKTWEDNSNGWKTRPNPSDFTVKLYEIRKGENGYPETGTLLERTPTWTFDEEHNQWTYTFDKLPVFDDDGEFIKYYAEEVEPAGYSLKEGTGVPVSTTGTLGRPSSNKVTSCNSVDWTLGSQIDVAFVIVKTTDQKFIVWTHRAATPYEMSLIEAEGASWYGDYSSKPKIYRSGTCTVPTSKGDVTFTVSGSGSSNVNLTFGGQPVWAWFIKGQFNGTAYNAGRTDFTNTLKETKLPGTKTWKTTGTATHDNAEDITLKLTRISAKEGSTAEIVHAKSEAERTVYTDEVTNVFLQPVWDGNNYTYSHLPEKDKEGYAYTYHVAEQQFRVGEVTYTAVKDADGNYTVTSDPETAPAFTVVQTDNDFVNTETKEYEFTKIWKKTDDTIEPWPEGKTISISLYSTTGTAAGTLIGEFVLNAQGGGEDTYTWTGTKNADNTYTFKITGLPATDSSGAVLSYYVIETKVDGYKNPIYAIKATEGAGGLIDTVNGVKLENAADKGYIINKPDDSVTLPESGGPGTVLFYGLGIALASMAGLLLFIKKRNLRNLSERRW